MLKLFVFGSGSCGNCYYLTDGSDALLIDAGVGIRRLKRNAAEYGIKLGHAKALLITHDHADHVKNAGIVSKDYNLDVYATKAVHEGIDRCYMIKQKISLEKKKIFEPNTPFCIGPYTINAFPIPHDSSENVGYHITYGEENICLMTDVGAVTEEVKKHIGLANHLVIEANYDPEMLKYGRYPALLKERISSGTGHLSNIQTANALCENIHEGLKNIWLCHLSEENNHPELAKKTIETHLRSFGIICGKDVNLEVLRRKVPTGPFEL